MPHAVPSSGPQNRPAFVLLKYRQLELWRTLLDVLSQYFAELAAVSSALAAGFGGGRAVRFSFKAGLPFAAAAAARCAARHSQGGLGEFPPHRPSRFARACVSAAASVFESEYST